jgi:glycosyltransferase involved in cell wall biosynthesis
MPGLTVSTDLWQIERSGGGISVHSPAEFSEALRRMRDPSARQRMGEAGRSLVQSEYSWKTVLDGLVKEIKEISCAE